MKEAGNQSLVCYNIVNGLRWVELEWLLEDGSLLFNVQLGWAELGRTSIGHQCCFEVHPVTSYVFFGLPKPFFPFLSYPSGLLLHILTYIFLFLFLSCLNLLRNLVGFFPSRN